MTFEQWANFLAVVLLMYVGIRMLLSNTLYEMQRKVGRAEEDMYKDFRGPGE